MEIALKAVLFDLGWTLIKTAPIPEILSRILLKHGIRRPLAQIDSALKEVNEQVRPEDYSLSYDDFWKLYNSKTLRRLGIHENVEELAIAVNDDWWDNSDVDTYPDVKETLETLKERGVKIGIVTNGFQFDVEEILRRTTMTGFFDVTVGADVTRKPKPYKEIFLYALNMLGVLPQDALFVGDNPELDYEAAEKVGLKPLLIDRDDVIHEEIRKTRDLREVVRYI
jgi:putative hydrolase of the HAD superfamily